MAKGSCVCGAVAFEVGPPYLFFQYCHCSRCRKRSGSIHAANLLVKADQVTWLRGEDKVTRFELASAVRWGNSFCEVCGSPMPSRSRDGGFYVVPAGGLDEDPGMRPTRNIWMDARAPWEVPASELPDVEGSPPRPGAPGKAT
jgi:hypothetical protein